MEAFAGETNRRKRCRKLAANFLSNARARAHRLPRQLFLGALWLNQIRNRWHRLRCSYQTSKSGGGSECRFEYHNRMHHCAAERKISRCEFAKCDAIEWRFASNSFRMMSAALHIHLCRFPFSVRSDPLLRFQSPAVIWSSHTKKCIFFLLKIERNEKKLSKLRITECKLQQNSILPAEWPERAFPTKNGRKRDGAFERTEKSTKVEKHRHCSSFSSFSSPFAPFRRIVLSKRNETKRTAEVGKKYKMIYIQQGCNSIAM